MYQLPQATDTNTDGSMYSGDQWFQSMGMQGSLSEAAPWVQEEYAKYQADYSAIGDMAAAKDTRATIEAEAGPVPVADRYTSYETNRANLEAYNTRVETAENAAEFRNTAYRDYRSKYLQGSQSTLGGAFGGSSGKSSMVLG